MGDAYIYIVCWIDRRLGSSASWSLCDCDASLCVTIKASLCCILSTIHPRLHVDTLRCEICVLKMFSSISSTRSSQHGAKSTTPFVLLAFDRFGPIVRCTWAHQMDIGENQNNNKKHMIAWQFLVRRVVHRTVSHMFYLYIYIFVTCGNVKRFVKCFCVRIHIPANCCVISVLDPPRSYAVHTPTRDL